MSPLIKDVPENFTFRVPYDPRVSEKTMRDTAELWAHYQQDAAKRQRERVKEFAEILRQRGDKLRSVIGGDHYFALQRFKQALRLAVLKKTKPPYGLGISRAELVAEQSRRVSNFLSERGVNPRKVRAAISNLFQPVSLPGDPKMSGQIQDEFFDPPLTSLAQTFEPPFMGRATGIIEGAWGFRVEHRNLAAPEAGQVGVLIEMHDDDAGDNDFGLVDKESLLAVWFLTRGTGLIEVVMNLQCGMARHQLTRLNEWGFSSSHVRQQHMLMMHVIHPNAFEPTFNLAADFDEAGDDGESFDRRPFFHGQLFQSRNLVSTGPIPAGQRVLVVFGCRSHDRANANDMEIHSRSSFSWHISRVHVQVLT